MPYSDLVLELDNRVAHITLNRPQAANTLSLEMSRELLDAAIHCEAEGARAVVISGAGRMFCAGGDLRSFATRQGVTLTTYVTETLTALHAALSRLTRMDAPVIAAVHGSAAGAGFSLICACDLVLAASSARFTMAYTRSGLTPDGSATYFLPRLVGLRRALELTLTNRVLSAQEACQWGLVTRVVSEEELPGAALELAQQLAQGPTGAFGAAKRLLQQSFGERLESQMENEARAILKALAGAESREGITAFLEKRSPNFK